MKISVDFLKAKGACQSAITKFQEKFPDGAEYQAVLDALAAENRADWANWLLRAAGPDHTAVMEISGNLEVAGHLFFSGQIKVTGRLTVGKWLFAGSGIKAGSGIEAGWGIKAGSGIEAGSGIKAGEDFGIFAGLRLRISSQKEYGVVRAKEKPKNLLFGIFKKSEKKKEKKS